MLSSRVPGMRSSPSSVMPVTRSKRRTRSSKAFVTFRGPKAFFVGLAVVIHSGRWSGSPRKPEAGTALYRLSRFAKIGQPGQVVVSYSTAALLEGDPRYSRLRNLGEVDVPDFDEPVRAYELLDPS